MLLKRIEPERTTSRERWEFGDIIPVTQQSVWSWLMADVKMQEIKMDYLPLYCAAAILVWCAYQLIVR